MAIYSGSNFGTLRNKIGGAVGYTSRGQTIARSMPQGYTDANTVIQQINRLKAAAVGKWIRYHKAKLTAFIGRPKAPQTKVSTIQKELYKYFACPTPPASEPDYTIPYGYLASSHSAVEFGEGNIDFPETFTVTYQASPSALVFSFSDVYNSDKSSPYDVLHVLMLKNSQSGVLMFNTTIERQNAGSSFQLPDITPGLYDIYPIFVSSVYGSSFAGTPTVINIP